jgi:hypothetical protein
MRQSHLAPTYPTAVLIKLRGAGARVDSLHI